MNVWGVYLVVNDILLEYVLEVWEFFVIGTHVRVFNTPGFEVITEVLLDVDKFLFYSRITVTNKDTVVVIVV